MPLTTHTTLIIFMSKTIFGGRMQGFKTIAMYVVTGVALSGCGGGDGDISGSDSTNYVSSAALGEVMLFNVDVANLTYDYEVIESRFGCSAVGSVCQNGSGTLELQPDGTYEPSGSPTTKLFIADNGLLVGGYKLAPDLPAAPVLGFSSSSLVSSFAPMDLLFAGLACETKTETALQSCKTVWGNLVTQDGSTFSLCRRGQVASCGQSEIFEGDVEYSGRNSVWRLKVDDDVFANMVLTKAEEGAPTIGFIDFNSPTFGYGNAKISTKVTLTNELVQDNSGTWVLANEAGQTFLFGLNDSGELSTGNTVTLNDPADGFAKITGDADGPYISLQTGLGMFSIINNVLGTETYASKYFIGVKLSSDPYTSGGS